ncbi:DNA internalization-related competence protein ComEC/Rec2 [Hydrogenophaga sp.]|uniref:DNA internalization-related competence protein ComEC/Rec2 n=1 Tax=Hydrogenophaga sp. TaxID=1904254 RepID=UPI002607889F|nr:DNA internalization-related competence protein ComEC/Rec2 [Hydrogenophaga sp.]
MALQLQQAALSPLGVYLALLGLALVPWVMAWGWRSGRAGWPWARHGMVLALLAGVLAGFGYAGLRGALLARGALDPALQGHDIELTGRIASLPQQGPQGERFDFQVDTAQLRGEPVRLPPLLQLSWYGGLDASGDGGGVLAARSPGLRAGERWRFTARLRSPHGHANPHGFDRELWFWERGIQATGYVRSGPRDPAPQRLGASPWYSLDAARQAVSERIDIRLAEHPRSAGVIAALVVGEQSAIERADWDLFRTTGVAHLMSISGLHVTMFAWLATVLLTAMWGRLAHRWPPAVHAVPTQWVAGAGGVALAAAYAVFSGWGVPSQRTLIMLAVVVGLRFGVRRWPWPVVWLLAMVAVLALDPWALLQPGFWLSFVAVGVLFATDPGSHASSPAPRGGLPRVARALVSLVREQGVVTVALAPLTLVLFGQFSLVGLLANLVAIPLVTLWITPLAMLGVLLPPVWDAAAWAVQAMSLGLAWLAQWPWAAIVRPVAPWPLALAAVVGGVLLVSRLPWSLRLAGLTLVWPALLYLPPRPAAGEFELIALDVGQGSAVLLRTAGHSLLYDTGPRYGPQNDAADAGDRVVLPLLRALGETLDAVVVSHRDSDHAGGAASVQAAQPHARWLSSYDAEPGRRCVAGQRWHWDGVDFEVLHPQPVHYGEGGAPRLSSNAMSCVLHVSNGRHSAWLGGDIDAAQEVRLALARPGLRATVMLAPHHGSQTSSSPVLLNTLAPRWVIVQSGYRNRFGHPAESVLERYRQRGIPWVASPECGAATWRSDQPDAIACQREMVRRYWHALAAHGE